MHRARICICHHCLRRAKFRATLAYCLLVDAILVPVDPINGFGGGVGNTNSKRCLSYRDLVLVNETNELVALVVSDGVIFITSVHWGYVYMTVFVL